MALDLNIPKVVLDPATEAELTQLAYDQIKLASGNTINDFRPGSAIAAFVEGQTFALAELLYYLNLMPEAIAVEVFRLYGVQRSFGTYAAGELTFYLTNPALDPFVLPAGYSVPYLDTLLVLQTSLNIPAGGQEATVGVVSSVVGSKYNAAAFDILATSTGLGLVQSIFNRKVFTGGTDIEPLVNLLARCQAATVRRSSVITKLDYETAALDLLGVGSRAVAIANLSPDGITFQQNSVGVFLLDATGKPASLTTCATITSALKQKILIGTGVTCKPAVILPLTVELFINVSLVSDSVGQEVISAIKKYLTPNSYPADTQVRHNELMYIARQVVGVRSVDSVLLNGNAIDYLLAQSWYYPYADAVVVSMIDPSGATLQVSGVFGDNDFTGE